MTREQVLLRRARLLTLLFIFALVLAGATAIPLEAELNLAAKWLGVASQSSADTTSSLAHWLLKVREGLHESNTKYPFLAYGTDWLAFGHFVIAVAFLGALRDPVRNRWLFTFGMIACALVVPYAFIMGGLRGIPIGWRLIDCSFGVLAIVPLWFCRCWTKVIERSRNGIPE
jgi:hypothetical protein